MPAPRPHLWEIERPEQHSRWARPFNDVHSLFAALNRPIQPPVLTTSHPDSEPGEIDPAQLAPQLTPKPRVLDWACRKHVDDELIASYKLQLLVVPSGEHRVEVWSAPMRLEEEGQVRVLLAELGDQHAVEWAGTLPDPCEVADLIGCAASAITEKALAATGLPAEQLVDAYVPARGAALASITTLLEHAAEQGWTATRIVEAWELYCDDVEPMPR